MGLFAGTDLDLPPHCDQCGELESECVCPPPPPFRLEPSQQTARLCVEKRKKGKVVTVVRGLPSHGNDLRQLLTDVKNHCGAGGTLANAEAEIPELEIQGDHLSRVEAYLKQNGFKVKTGR